MSANTGIATEQVAEALRSVSGPIFAATWSDKKQGTVLTVHASATGRQRELKTAVAAALSGLGIGQIKVRFHAASRLLSPRSLERLVERFAGDSIAYDPTSSLSRAKALVSASHSVRAALGEHIRGLYYAPALRSFYVSLDSARVAVGDKLKVAELANIERAVLSAVSNAFAMQLTDCPAVRVGFGLPASGLVPVDQGSIMRWNLRFTRAVRRYWKPITVAALFGMGSAAARADQPAVADPNLKVSGTFGQVIDDYSWQAQGQFTAPLGDDFGIAVEGGASAVAGHETYAAGAHIFTRDPDLYLLGIFGGYARSNDFDMEVIRTGAEGEFYLSQLSILATAGYQFSDGGSLEDGAFGSIDLRWYITNNFYVQGGGSFEKDHAFGRAGIEWQPGFAALPGLAFNANGVWGADDYHSIMGGLTYYFGVPASLKDRHRKYDPESALFGLFQSVQQEQARMAAAYGAPVVPPPAPVP